MEFEFLTNLLANPDLSQVVVERLEIAFYPTLLGILIIASLGLPIPEDIPLIAAGVVLKTSPETATWYWTFVVALIGIMSGDLVLYTFGKTVGPSFVRFKFVRWFVTPERFEKTVVKFEKYGAWAIFFGRFFMGVRAMMCMTAGATRYSYWRFFLADLCGAVISIPLFILLGYWFADMIPVVQEWVKGVNTALLVTLSISAVVVFIVWKIRRIQKAARKSAKAKETATSSNAA